MAYDVRHDTQLLDRLGALFDTQYAANSHCAEIRSGPIFIVGLPRSGTTLVDRIVSSHSCVESMGEINDLALTLTRLCDTSDKPSLLEMSARLDPDALGAGYLQSVNSYGRTAEFFTDKTPANFLYLGLIARALPGAKILHLRRHPVDSCLAMYRTLFRMGYPFSYNLDDLAEYYIAYDALMQHWHATFPGRIMDVSYEQLVDDQERMSRQIIQFCGLDWEAQCLRFDENAKPVATASAVQVRQPIYRDALARWRHYERQLSPLIQKLAEAGIEL